MTSGRFTSKASREEHRRVWVRKLCLTSFLPLLAMVNPALGAPFVDPSTGHSYEVIEEDKSWDNAQAAAAAMSTAGRSCHLATITSQAEDEFVVAQLPADTEMWIGGRQRDNLVCDPNVNDPSYWGTWVTGEAWSYTNWDTGDGEPDDCAEQCLGYGEDDPILWENAPCGDTSLAAFLVECEPVTVGTPLFSWSGTLAVLVVLLAIGTHRLWRQRQV